MRTHSSYDGKILPCFHPLNSAFLVDLHPCWAHDGAKKEVVKLRWVSEAQSPLCVRCTPNCMICMPPFNSLHSPTYFSRERNQNSPASIKGNSSMMVLCTVRCSLPFVHALCSGFAVGVGCTGSSPSPSPFPLPYGLPPSQQRRTWTVVLLGGVRGDALNKTGGFRDHMQEAK